MVGLKDKIIMENKYLFLGREVTLFKPNSMNCLLKVDSIQN